MVLGLTWMRATFLASSLVFATCCVAQTIHEPTSKQTESLKTFLQKYLGEPYPPFERERASRYSSVFVDLTDDGTREVIVYVSGRSWCGTGGLSHADLGFRRRIVQSRE